MTTHEYAPSGICLYCRRHRDYLELHDIECAAVSIRPNPFIRTPAVLEEEPDEEGEPSNG